MAQDWYSPADAATEPPMTPAPPPPLPADLRPLSLGEILDRTFAIFRGRFVLFAGIAATYALTALALQLLNLLVRHVVVLHRGFNTGSVAAVLGTWVTVLLLLVPSAVAQAATVYALSEVYLGRGTTSLNALRETAGRWYRYVGIAFWISFAAFWLPAVVLVPAFIFAYVLRGNNFAVGLIAIIGVLVFLATIPYAIWTVLRNSLAVQVSVIENATVRTSMRRSKILTVGAKGRIFVVALIVGALSMVVGTLQAPLAFVVMKSPLQEHNMAQAIGLVVNALAQVVIIPIGFIGMSLVYFDQRVRQEGFDLLLLLGPQPPMPQQSPQPAPAAYSEPPLHPIDPIHNDGSV